jgi:hypothetical protein
MQNSRAVWSLSSIHGYACPDLWQYSGFLKGLGIDKVATLDSSFRGPTGAAQVFFCQIAIDLGFIESCPTYAGFADSLHGFVGEQGFGH